MNRDINLYYINILYIYITSTLTHVHHVHVLVQLPTSTPFALSQVENPKIPHWLLRIGALTTSILMARRCEINSNTPMDR